MKILVTGAKGFVGKNLTLALKQLMIGNDKTRPNLKIDEIKLKYTVDANAANVDAYYYSNGERKVCPYSISGENVIYDSSFSVISFP